MMKALKKSLFIGFVSVFIFLSIVIFQDNNTSNGLNHKSRFTVDVKSDVKQSTEKFEVQHFSSVTLSQSDTYSKKMIDVIANGMDLTPYLINENIIRKFVIFISYLAQGDLHYPTLPTHRPEETLKVKKVGSELYIADENFYRYKLYALALNHINEEQVALAYQHMTPLLNEAFQELGSDDVSFHTTFVKALNVIIRTPPTNKMIQIKKVNQNYRFKNSKFEALSPVQKLMIRMGPDNATLIQKKATAILNAIESSQ